MEIKKAILEGKVISKTRGKIEKYIGELARKYKYAHGPIQKNKIFAMTFDSSYNCNISYIIDEIVKRDLNVDIVLVSNSKGKVGNIKRMPACVRTVKRGSIEMFEEQATAKLWLDNALNCVWFGLPKKEDQIYINTWHGSMGIKRLSGNDTWLWRAGRCKDMTDYVISNSRFEERVYEHTFWKDVPVLRYGHARNDIFFNEEEKENIRLRVREELGLEPDTKILLYAPTFRDDGDTSCFDLDYERIRAKMDEKYGGNWVIAVRFHNKNKSVSSKIIFDEHIINGTKYRNMQDFMIAADAGITDYSSWAYDFILLNKPLFLYIPDVEKYDNQRGFYYSIETTPFLKARNNDELSEAVDNFDQGSYSADVKSILRRRGCYEKGNSAVRTVDKIEELMGL